MHLEPCPTCGRPAMIGDGPGNTWQIGCFRSDCDQKPISYEANNKRSRAAALRTWNAKRKQA